MITLFLSISGGDWGELASPVADVRGFMIIVYAFYVLMIVFGILNVLTGTFVETAIQAAATDRDSAIEVTMREQHSYVHKLRKMFEETDADRSGQISFDEFESHLKNAEVSAYLKSMGLEPTEARGLFQLLDVDNSNNLDIEELVSGCMRMKGTARAVDVATLIYENKRVMKKHAVFADYCHDQFAWLEKAMRSIADSISDLGRGMSDRTDGAMLMSR